MNEEEVIVHRFRAAIASSADVTAHPSTVDHGAGIERWMTVHIGPAHLVSLPRDRFLEALYREATDVLGEDPARRPN